MAETPKVSAKYALARGAEVISICFKFATDRELGKLGKLGKLGERRLT